MKKPKQLPALPDGTRLNDIGRRFILRGLMNHRFSDRLQDMIRRRAAFAMEVYNRTFTPQERAKMKRLPEGWLKSEHYISVQVVEKSDTIGFNGSLPNIRGLPDRVAYFLQSADHSTFGSPPKKDYMIVPYRYNSLKIKTVADPIFKLHKELDADWNALVEEIKEADKLAGAILWNCSSIGKLKAAWPECEPFLPRDEDDARDGSRIKNLPAIATATLNNAFGLPV
ncbi:MAG: hypothetical protein JWN75_1234 [Candidatus Saccharibacteria bacterium]|nr:hypothetical protein [Candidatus Saccharibacteria bacterium]